MMSMFCSSTLTFAPECLKCILRGPDLKKFWGGGMPPDPPPYKLGPLALQVTPSARVFSFSTYSKAFVIYVKPY